MAEQRTSGEMLGRSTLEEMDVHLSKENFVQLLRNMADGLESGRVFEIEIKDEHFFLPPEGEMEVEIDQAEREIEFKFNWRY